MNRDSARVMNALDHLKADHQKIRDLFVSLRESSTIPEKREVFQGIRDALELHSHVEETVFYPAFQAHEDFADLVAEALEDHQEMRDIIDEIEDTDEEEDFVDLLDELVDTVERHIEDEEHDFFDEASTVLNDNELNSLGARIAELKSEMSQAA